MFGKGSLRGSNQVNSEGAQQVQSSNRGPACTAHSSLRTFILLYILMRLPGEQKKHKELNIPSTGYFPICRAQNLSVNV